MSAVKSGELFAGVAGLSRAIDEVFGAMPAWFAEIDAAPSKVLEYRFPGVPNLGDVSAVDFTTAERVNVLAGGFPCQDVSLAGRRRGLKEGTRSGLWSEFARAIDEIRPDWVVIENVRGLLSADATGDVEPCPWCLGDTTGEHALRALGAVLGDLAELGFDAEWTGLRAADVGAPHGRFRVFILAWPAANTRHGLGRQTRPEPTGGDDAARGSDRGGSGSGDHRGLTLLPTPAAMSPNDGEGTETWLTRREQVKAKGINGNGMGMPLSIAVQLLPTPEAKLASSGPDYARAARDGSGGDDLTTTLWKHGLHLLPTPQVADGTGGHATRSGARSDELLLPGAAKQIYERGNDATPESRPGKAVRDLRSEARAQAVHERKARGSRRVPPTDALLPGMREHETTSASRDASLAGQEVESGGVRGVPGHGRSAGRAPHRPESGEQRSCESRDAVRELPPETPLEGRSQVQQEGIEWGPYEPAIRRWEAVLGRPAPSPVTLDGRGGKTRLNPALCEFMMGWPKGWVTAPEIGLTRSEQLKAIGNGVCTLQAVHAVRSLLNRPGVPALASLSGEVTA